MLEQDKAAERARIGYGSVYKGVEIVKKEAIMPLRKLTQSIAAKAGDF